MGTDQPDRIAATFDRGTLAGRNRAAAFISYTCAGDPDGPTSLRVLDALVEAGVDVLEIGMPFSDPLADGPTNQAAAERALRAGFHGDDGLALVATVRERHPETPLVLYTYYNLLYARGVEEYLRAAAAAGVDGILVLDLPPEEAEGEYLEACRRHGIRTVFIVAPTTPPDRIPRITAVTTGFVYYVSREGVTGERSEQAEGVGEAVAAIRAHTDRPVVVGFGISTREQVAATAPLADGVVVGSAIVRRVAGLTGEEAPGMDAFRAEVADMVGGCGIA
jgi:tryptophan synthase alpha chain